MRSAGPARTAEFSRILALPRRQLDLSAVVDFTELFAKDPAVTGPCHVPHCQIVAEGQGKPQLRPIQNAMLAEAATANGGFFPVGVGYGKTLTSLLLPHTMASRRAVLLVPAQMRRQLLADIPHLAQHFNLPPFTADCLHRDKAGGAFFTTEIPPPSGDLVVLAYSQLSSSNFAEILDLLQPDLIIADEAHNLRHRDAARTRRFLRYFKDHPECRFVAMSGTLTSKSICDYAHLSELALRKNSPLPKPWRELQSWAAVLDAQNDPTAPNFQYAGEGALALLCDDQETPRDGFRRRMIQTPGVVATDASAVQCSLTIGLDDADFLAKGSEIDSMLAAFEKTWTIGGQEIDSAAHAAKVRRRIMQGFYYKWTWPMGIDHEWLDARNAWNRTVRKYLSTHNRPGWDSPKLLEQRARFGLWPVQEWYAWAAVKDRPGPATDVVWFSEVFIERLTELLYNCRMADEFERTIVWVNDPPVGERLARHARVPYFGQGSDAELLRTGARMIICSIQAHGTGKNLQAWNHNIVAFPPSNGATWEQMLGRTHRPGQLSDQVTCHVMAYSDLHKAAWHSALNDARYIQETTGQRQKLLYANILS